MNKLILTYILLILNIAISLNFIMYNEELIIFISLITAFGIIFTLLKKNILNWYFIKIDEIYYHYSMLLILNKWINNYFIKNLNKVIFLIKNVNINLFLILIKDLLKFTIIKPNLNRVLNNIINIYKYILNIQNINNKNLYLLLINKNLIKNQYILLSGIIYNLNKKIK